MEVIDGMTWHLIEFSTSDRKRPTFLEVVKEFKFMFDGIALVWPDQIKAWKRTNKEMRTLQVLLPPERDIYPCNPATVDKFLTGQPLF